MIGDELAEFLNAVGVAATRFIVIEKNTRAGTVCECFCNEILFFLV